MFVSGSITFDKITCITSFSFLSSDSSFFVASESESDVDSSSELELLESELEDVEVLDSTSASPDG